MKELLHEAIFCDLKRYADESIVRRVTDYMIHACNLPHKVANGREK